MRIILYTIIFLNLIACNQEGNLNGTEDLRQKSVEALKELNWKTDFNQVESLLKPAIRIDQRKLPNQNEIGISKFGGKPDLPKGKAWPTFEGKPMIFLAQINLAEIADLDVNNELPKSGLVFFFIHFKKPVNEFGAEYQFVFNKKEYKVFYSENRDLKRTDFPKNLIVDYRFKATRMEFKPFYSFPSSETLEIKSLNEQDHENAYSFNDVYGNHEGEQILGYTMPIQYDVTWDWAFSYLDFQSYELSELDKQKIDSVRPEFVNILQFSLENSLTGFEKIGISIGYFGITKKDLKNTAFDNSILIFQDT